MELIKHINNQHGFEALKYIGKKNGRNCYEFRSLDGSLLWEGDLQDLRAANRYNRFEIDRFYEVSARFEVSRNEGYSVVREWFVDDNNNRKSVKRWFHVLGILPLDHDAIWEAGRVIA